MKLIGIAGKAGSGKDTVADYLVREHDFMKLSWADALKRGLAAMGMPEPADRALKEELIRGLPFTWRQAAQTLGTEWGRALDLDIWVKLTMQDVANAQRLFARSIVISDCRFENETAAIRAAGGTIWHIFGREADLGEHANHASEKGVMFYPTQDGLIKNDKDLEHLHQMVREGLREVERMR